MTTRIKTRRKSKTDSGALRAFVYVRVARDRAPGEVVKDQRAACERLAARLWPDFAIADSFTIGPKNPGSIDAPCGGRI